MKWTHKHHNVIMKVLNPFERVLAFIEELSWSYAWYRNDDRAKSLDLYQNLSFWRMIKIAWKLSKYRD